LGFDQQRRVSLEPLTARGKLEPAYERLTPDLAKDKEMSNTDPFCGSHEHVSRRTLLKLAGIGGLSWLTPVAHQLAIAAEANPTRRAKSLIVLWLEGAPSQLETFDPHPDTEIAAGSLARKTNVPGILVGEGLEQVAEQMDSIALVRAVTSKEGDHERAIYNVKTGYRPDPTLVHPAIGSVICHELNSAEDQGVAIPRHVSILPASAPGRGGYLGDQFDAFKVFDPQQPIPDVRARVENRRQLQRINDLQFADQQFLKRRTGDRIPDALVNQNLDAALKMMSSDQLEAFDISNIPTAERMRFGDTSFGRGCLAAIGLIEAGVRCVEITLTGWDTHVNNHELQAGRIKILDPAFAALIVELKNRGLLETTLVACGGEFGRTPRMNPVGGRDHWPHGFSIALAGGGIQGGRVVGETSPRPNLDGKNPLADLKDSRPVEDVHATILSALGIQYEKELQTPIGRPMKICQGRPIRSLLDF
jgi:uncharacterized protein (DUF1501 family)